MTDQKSKLMSASEVETMAAEISIPLSKQMSVLVNKRFPIANEDPNNKINVTIISLINFCMNTIFYCDELVMNFNNGFGNIDKIIDLFADNMTIALRNHKNIIEKEKMN